MAGVPPSISPTEDDLTPVAGVGRLSTVDNRTLYGTPAPLAASTVNRPPKTFDRLLAAGGQGSFLDSATSGSTFSNPPGVDDLGLMKLSLSGFESTRSQTDLQKYGTDSLKFAGSIGSLPGELSRTGPDRSSMGLIPVEDMHDLSSSLLQFDASLPKGGLKEKLKQSLPQQKQAVGNAGSSKWSGQDQHGSNIEKYRNSSKASSGSVNMVQTADTSIQAKTSHVRGSLSKMAPPSEHSVLKTVSSGSFPHTGNERQHSGFVTPANKARHQELGEPSAPGQTPFPAGPSLGLDVMTGGMTFGSQAQDDGEMSVHEVEFGEDELRQFDDEFSDIGELTLTGDLTINDEANENESPGEVPDVLPGQQIPELWRQGGNPFDSSQFDNAYESQGVDLGERGEASGQRSEEGELMIRHSVGEGQEDTGRNHRIFNYTSGHHGTNRRSVNSQFFHQMPHPHEVGDGEEEDGSPAHRMTASQFADEELADLQQEQDIELLGMDNRYNYPTMPSADSSDFDTEDEIEAVRRENGLRRAHDGNVPVSRDFRPGLEGVNHEDADMRQSAEGDVVSSPVPGDGGGGGDGSSGHSSDDDATGTGAIAQFSQSSDPHTVPRNVPLSSGGFRGQDGFQSYNPFDVDDPQAQPRVRPQGDDHSNPMQNNSRHVRFASPAEFRDRTCSGVSFGMVPQDPWHQDVSGPVSHLGFQFSQSASNSRPSANVSQSRGLDSGAFELGEDGSMVSEGESDQALFPEEDEVGEPHDITFSGKVSFGDAGELSLLQPCTSPMSDRVRDSHGSRESSDGCQYNAEKCAVSDDGEGGSDLAYYTPLDQMANAPNPFDVTAPSLNFGASMGASVGIDFGNVVDLPGDDEFISGDKGLAMLDTDQEKFEKENVFTQEDAMIPVAGTPDSWTLHSAVDLTHPSWKDSDEETQAYMRISIGTFMRTRTEALGSLDGDVNTPKIRPNFGTHIVTPPDNLPPVRLLPQASPILEEARQRHQGPTSENVRGPGVGSDIDAEVGDRPMQASDLDLSPSENVPSNKQKTPSSDPYLDNGNTKCSSGTVTPVRYLSNGFANGSFVPQGQYDFAERPETPGSLTDGESSLSNHTTDNESDASSNRSSSEGVNLSAITRFITSAPATANPEELADVILKMSIKHPAASKSSSKRENEPVQKPKSKGDIRNTKADSGKAKDSTRKISNQAQTSDSRSSSFGLNEKHRPGDDPKRPTSIQNASRTKIGAKTDVSHVQHSSKINQLQAFHDSPEGPRPATVIRKTKIPGHEYKPEGTVSETGPNKNVVHVNQKNLRPALSHHVQHEENKVKRPAMASPTPPLNSNSKDIISSSATYAVDHSNSSVKDKSVYGSDGIKFVKNKSMENCQSSLEDGNERSPQQWNSPRPSLLMSQRQENPAPKVCLAELLAIQSNSNSYCADLGTEGDIADRFGLGTGNNNYQNGLPHQESALLKKNGKHVYPNASSGSHWPHDGSNLHHDVPEPYNENLSTDQQTPKAAPTGEGGGRKRFSSTPSRPGTAQNFTIHSSGECLSHISPYGLQDFVDSEDNTIWSEDGPTPKANDPRQMNQYYESEQEQVTPRQSPQKPQHQHHSGLHRQRPEHSDPVSNMYFDKELQTASANQGHPLSPPSHDQTTSQHSHTPLDSWQHSLFPGKPNSIGQYSTSIPTLLTSQPLSTTPFASEYLGSSVSGTGRGVMAVPHLTAQTATVSSNYFNNVLPGVSMSIPSSTRRDTAISEGPISDDTTLNVSPEQRLSDIGCPSHHSTMQSQYRSSPVERNGPRPAHTCVTPSNYHHGNRPLPSVVETNWSALKQHNSPQSHHIPYHKGSYSNDFSMRVSVPPEVRVQEVCCVGLSASGTLPLYNPSTRWLHVGLHVKRVCLNGLEQDANKCVPFVMKEKVIIEPGTTEDIKVIFAPRQAGVFVAELHIFSSPVVADQPIDEGQVPAMVTLQAIAEHPNVQVLTDGTQCLDFGALPWGCQKAMPIILFNQGRARIPVRLTITSNRGGSHCFSFDKQPSGNTSLISGMPRPSSPSMAPTVVNYALSPAEDDPQPVNVVVYFKAPPKQPDRILPIHPEEFSAIINVQIDTPTYQDSLSTMELRAAVGTARLHAPHNKEVMFFKADIGRCDSALLPLRNAGNIPLEVSLEVTHWPDFFSVQPSHVIIQPGSQTELNITFQPKQASATKFDSLLLMYVQPDGPGYEIDLTGEVQRPRPLPAPAKPKGPLLLSNKHYLAWGGIAVGHALQQSLTLKNNGDRLLKLSLEIRDNTKDFQFQSSFGKNGAQTKEVMLKPKEEYPIQVLFAPSRVAVAEGRLRIVVKDVLEQAKYTIPLTAYGGISQLELERLPTGQSGNYWISMGPITVGNCTTMKATLRNTGSRTAFVKALPFQDLGCKKHFSRSNLTVQPMDFCLKPQESQAVVVTLSPSEREAALCMNKNCVICSVAFFYGDELSRWKLRRAFEKCKQQPIALGKDNPVRDVDFTMHFQGEDFTFEETSVQSSQHDVELFYSTMRKTLLALVGEVPPPVLDVLPVVNKDISSDFGQLQRTTNQYGSYQIRSPPRSQQTAMSIISQTPPVKGTPATHLTKTGPVPELGHKPPLGKKMFATEGNLEKHLANAHGHGVSSLENEQNGWELKPPQLIVLAPKPNCDIMIKKVQIINYSERPLNYELSWPAHLITASPEQGTIPPRSVTTVSVMANSSIRSKVQLPWQGRIQVCSDNQSKILEVQVREDLTMDDTVTSSMTPRQTLQQDPSSSPLITKPTTGGLHSAILHISAEKLVFPATMVGLRQELNLELTNVTLDPVKWVVSSFASPYMKKLSGDVESGGSILRATYVVFYMPTKAGVLQAKESVKVPVSFCPREAGAYSQYWEVRSECPTGPDSTTHTCKVEFTGEGSLNARLQGTHTQHLSSSDDIPPEVPVAGPILKSKKRPTGRQLLIIQDNPIKFPVTQVHERTMFKLQIKNKDKVPHSIKLISIDAPFSMSLESALIKNRHYMRIPLHFRPTQPAIYHGTLVLQTDLGDTLTVKLLGESK